MRVSQIFLPLFCLIISLGATEIVSKKMVAYRVDTLPAIDGVVEYEIWSQAQTVTVYDSVAKIPLMIKSIYNKERLAFLVEFSDKTENRVHRQLQWSDKNRGYIDSDKREDIFIFKWNMSSHKSTLTLNEDIPYEADIWFWKANRTDPLGYADDKFQTYSPIKRVKSRLTISEGGEIFYLTREGDAGKSAYEISIYTEKRDSVMAKYKNVTPQGSRADVRAKGVWENGIWTLEFSRKLQTYNSDDIQFNLDKKYPFALSRYEVTGHVRDDKLEQPLYGAGEVTEIIELEFGK